MTWAWARSVFAAESTAAEVDRVLPVVVADLGLPCVPRVRWFLAADDRDSDGERFTTDGPVQVRLTIDSEAVLWLHVALVDVARELAGVLRMSVLDPRLSEGERRADVAAYLSRIDKELDRCG